jgi:hypothetical protein
MLTIDGIVNCARDIWILVTSFSQPFFTLSPVPTLSPLSGTAWSFHPALQFQHLESVEGHDLVATAHLEAK